MSLSRKQQTFSLNVAKYIFKAHEMGISLTFGAAYRSKDQQYLYYHGKTINDLGELEDTNRKSWTMNSKHLSRLAVDFNFFIDGKLTYTDPKLIELGEYWESLHPKNSAGVLWTKHKDSPHIQMSP